MNARTAIRVAFVAGVAVVGTAQALSQSQSQQDIREEMKQDVGQAAQQAQTNIEELRAVRLTVKEVDKKNHRVLFEAQISPEASFESGKGTPIKLDQLKEGDEVRAAFDPVTGDVKAVKVLTVEEKAAEEKMHETK